MADALRIGMIGLDTSHAGAFTKILNTPSNPHHVPGGTVVKAFPGGSDAMAVSRDRVGKFTDEMRDTFHVEIVDSIDAAVSGVDAVMLTSVDGRQHLDQFKEIARAGAPVFIDKPFAASAVDARAILETADKLGVPVMSCSSVRYAAGIAELGEGADVLGCTSAGPVNILPDFPAYFWYGIHTAEVVFSKMGTGCREVLVASNTQADVITGLWDDGRAASIYGYRFEGVYAFEATVYTADGASHGVASTDPPYYALMLPHVLEFFRSGNSPIDPVETLAIAEFLEAANRSRASGKAVTL